jgi:CheY-like chemotaxis protein
MSQENPNAPAGDSEIESIKRSVNSLNNLLLGLQGYMGFMESAAQNKKEDLTFLGPMRELVDRACEVANTIHSQARNIPGESGAAPPPQQDRPKPTSLTESVYSPAGNLPPADTRVHPAPPPPLKGNTARLQPKRISAPKPGGTPQREGPPPPPPPPNPRREDLSRQPAPARQEPQPPQPMPPVPPPEGQPQTQGRILPQPRHTHVVHPGSFEKATHQPPRLPENLQALNNLEVINREGDRGLIMLVDDEEHLLYIASRMLASEGYSVINCEEVFEALAIYESVGAHVDVVILDFSMPTMNGEDVFYELTDLDPNAKIILSSGIFEQEIISRLLKKGLKAFLPKPYKKESLLQTVQAAIGKKS